MISILLILILLEKTRFQNPGSKTAKYFASKTLVGQIEENY